MSLLLLIGRLLFSAIFLAAAPRHFTAEAAAHAAELGVPLARLAVPASGLLALAGGLSVLAGYHTRLGAWLLVAFLVPVTVMMHAFWRLADPRVDLDRGQVGVVEWRGAAQEAAKRRAVRHREWLARHRRELRTPADR
jgi:putative oxidoreductase